MTTYERGDRVTPISPNRSDAPDPSHRVGPDRWPRGEPPCLFLPVMPIHNPWCWIEFGAAVTMNCVQATAIILTDDAVIEAMEYWGGRR